MLLICFGATHHLSFVVLRLLSNVSQERQREVDTSKILPSSDTTGKHIFKFLLKGAFMCLQACWVLK